MVSRPGFDETLWKRTTTIRKIVDALNRRLPLNVKTGWVKPEQSIPVEI